MQHQKQPGGWVAYSDGACRGNPGPASWGAVVLKDSEVIEQASGFLGRKTNQVAELTAAREALSRTPVGCAVTLVSDSQYVLKGISEWRKGWERRGWVNAKGEPVANQHLWQALFKEVDARKVAVKWVRGHSGDTYNEMCDQLANLAIDEARGGGR